MYKNKNGAIVFSYIIFTNANPVLTLACPIYVPVDIFNDVGLNFVPLTISCASRVTHYCLPIDATYNFSKVRRTYFHFVNTISPLSNGLL